MSDRTAELDVAALKRRYAEERAKRMRSDGAAQFVDLGERFPRFAEDPWSIRQSRDPVVAQVAVLIIGAGLGGLLAAAELRKRNVGPLLMIDKAGDFGGTWYWNRYPGCACDIDSYIYMPMLEETGYFPKEKYAKADEIYGYCKRLADHLDLNGSTLFNTEIGSVDWSEEKRRWLIATDHGDAIEARFVVSCAGLFNSPKLPAIPGIERYEGHVFHTSRWDYSFTGGRPGEPMEGLRDKTVGVIGTGATAVQVVPEVAKTAERLYVFQRTPSVVSYRGNKPTDPKWSGGLGAGWQRDRMDNFALMTSGDIPAVDLVDDAWTDIMKTITPPKNPATPIDPADIEMAEMRKMDACRQHIDALVTDPETAAALKPYYHFGCKRPTFSDEYLQSFNRPNVTLVDTGGRGVVAIGKTGPIVGDREYAVDCLIFATGFNFMTDYSKESGIVFTGRDGRTLGDHWSRGVRTLFGVQTHGFPNLFLVSYIQAGITYNYNHVAGEQAAHIAHIIARCEADGIAVIEPTAAAEQGWVDEVIDAMLKRKAFIDACTPGYANHEGQRNDAVVSNVPYMGGAFRYFDQMANWRAQADMPGMMLKREAVADAVPGQAS